MAAPGALNSASDASDPDRGLERQPAALIRVRLDGVLLACNDAALGLFGAGARPEVLNSNLTNRLVPAQRPEWQEFTSRCRAEGAASLECDLLLRDNTARRVLVQGVPLTEHPDGFESLLLHLREQPQTWRVEPSPQSAATDGRTEAKFAALEKQLEHSQLAALQKEREYGRDVAMLKAALAAAHAAKATAIAEQGRLQAVADASDAERERIAADHRAAVDALQQSLAEAVGGQSRMAARADEQTRELDLLRAEHHRALVDLKTATGVMADLRRQLSEAAAEHDRLAAGVEELQRGRDTLIAEHRRTLADLETRNQEALTGLRVEQAQLQARVAEYESERARTTAAHQAAVNALEQSVAQEVAERKRIAARADEQARAHDLDRGAHERAFADLEAARDAALADVHAQLTQTSAEHAALAERVEARERDLELLRAEHARAHEQLIAGHSRALADLEAGKRKALDEWRSQQSEALAEQRRLAARLEEHERERASLIAEHQRALADVEAGKGEALSELRTQLAHALADQRRLAAHADEQTQELDRLRAEHIAALTDLETRNRDLLAELRAELAEAATEHTRALAERAEHHERERQRMSAEHDRAIAGLQASQKTATAGLRSELLAALAEQQRLAALVEERDREREGLAAEHRRAIADLQASKQEAVAECERVMAEEQRALLVKDGSRGLTQPVSKMNAVLTDDPAAKAPVDAEPAADLLREPFDDADDAFVHQLLGGVSGTRRAEAHADPESVAPAQPAGAPSTVTAGDESADAVFDAQDAAFASRLMSTHRASGDSDDAAEAQTAQEPAGTQPTASEDS